MDTSLTAPIIQLEHMTDTGPVAGPVVAVRVTQQGMRAIREAYRKQDPWGADGGRIMVLVEDPFGCLVWPQPADGAL